MKDAVLEELAPAIRTVAEGQTYVSPRTGAAAAAFAATDGGTGPSE